MTKIKFQGFPEGSQVSLSAAQGSVTKGPLAVSAWKQPAASGNADFKIYSLWGTGDPGPRGGFELLDGALIEMPVPGNLQIYIDNETGFSTTDQRNLFYETDYGERYEAQFLNHPDLPADFANFDTSPTANTLGVYPGFTSGHVHRGTDMAGNPVLTRDYVNPVAGAPVGTMDKTVTVFVSDGLVSKTKTFTVRLIDPHRYYTNYSGLTYGTQANTPLHLQVDRNQRLGVIYVSRDGDFTGVPVGSNIYHMTVPNGILSKLTFQNTGGTAARAALGHTITMNGNTVGDYPWGSQKQTYAIFLKAGETYSIGADSGNVNPFGDENSLLASWGTANGGKAIISGENKRTYSINENKIFFTNEQAYRSWRFSNLEFACSDWDPSKAELREWWNELYYTNKTGTIEENTNGNLPANGYNGATLNNGKGVSVNVIGDVPDPVVPGAGKLITNRVVGGVFADSDTLTGPNGSIVFVAAGSRQDRVPKNVPIGINFAPDRSSGGEVIDGCIIRGAFIGIANPPEWSIISDTHFQNFFNYAVTGEAYNVTTNAMVISLPSSYQGTNRDFGGTPISKNRNNWNVVQDDFPNVPAENNISHCAMRIGIIQSWAMYKVRIHAYGGHGARHQPLLRLASNGSFFVGQQQVYMHKCIFSGGIVGLGASSLRFSAPCTPRAWLMEQSWLRGDFCTEASMSTEITNFGFRDTRIGWPANVTITPVRSEFTFTNFIDGDVTEAPNADTYEVNPLSNFFENCTFEFNASGFGFGSLVFDEDGVIRGIPIEYTNCTLDVDPDKVSSFESIP
jgi:hypothetical protein